MAQRYLFVEKINSSSLSLVINGNLIKKVTNGFKTEKLKEQEEPQVLFIERCLSFLKDGGRMAMVLPSGILGNEQEAYLR